MSEQKTRETSLNVSEILTRLPDETKRRDAETLVRIMKDITGHEPKIWGSNLIGFGRYHYKYSTGHEGEYFLVGFNPGKSKFSIYLMCGAEKYPHLLERLGKYKTGKACLYINKLSNVDMDVLKELIKVSFEAGPVVC